MHHVVLERWSRRRSLLHARDPRSKALALLVFLLCVATTRDRSGVAFALYLALLAAAALISGIPIRGALTRAGVVLPFSGIFAVITWMGGDGARAAALLARSYLSALAVLLTMATTPLPELLRGLESLGVPRFLLMVAHFLYRYLFVISEEAQHMLAAALSRGGAGRARVFAAAAGAVAVLFARSFARAEDIHRAMLARGFHGRFVLLQDLRAGWKDAAFLAFSAASAILVRLSA